MNFRTLIEQAFRDAQAEFEQILKQKLEALMGADEARAGSGSAKRRPTPTVTSKKKPGRPAASSKAAPAPAKRVRTASADIDALGEKVLKALAHGAPLGRGAIASAVNVDASSPVLGHVLAKLRKDGKLVMTGERRFAQYQAA